MLRQKDLFELLNNLQLLYSDLNRLILEYEIPREWESTPYDTWKTTDKATGFIPYQQYLYACIPDRNLLITLNAKSREIVARNTSMSLPAGMDIDHTKSILYVAGKTSVTLISLQNQKVLSRWDLPVKSNNADFRGIKISENLIYITIRCIHQIFLCNNLNGEIKKKFGQKNSSSNQGQYDFPMGITLNNKNLFICDRNNHRVQIVTKEVGIFQFQWGSKENKEGKNKGEFIYPSSIYLDKLEKILYIGDWYSVQLFIIEENQWIQRLGGEKAGSDMNHFNFVYGICKIENELYVSDGNNKRIQIFRRS